MHINKVASVMTVDRVAAQLGESVDFLYDVANEMDPEGRRDLGLRRRRLRSSRLITDFGIENLVELIKIHKELKSRANP